MVTLNKKEPDIIYLDPHCKQYGSWYIQGDIDPSCNWHFVSNILSRPCSGTSRAFYFAPVNLFAPIPSNSQLRKNSGTIDHLHYILDQGILAPLKNTPFLFRLPCVGSLMMASDWPIFSQSSFQCISVTWEWRVRSCWGLPQCNTSIEKKSSTDTIQ